MNTTLKNLQAERIVQIDGMDDLRAATTTSTRRMTGGGSQEAVTKQTEKAPLLVGFDWGTNKSCLKAAMSGSADKFFEAIVPTVVGYAKEGVVEGLLPNNAQMLFGESALKHRLHLKLVQPMVDGVVKDLTASRDFAQHMRSLINVPAGTEVRSVIGVPANADAAARENVRVCVAGLFDRVILIPEPFLAALGFRDESRLNDLNYVDPVKNSLFVDIGGGTTDICLVQGYYPTADDQISIQFAGDKVDQMFDAAIRKTYPDCELSTLKIRELKEKFSFVGNSDQPIIASVMVGGKVRKLDVTTQIAEACNELLNRILDTIRVLISRASSDSVTELLQNIVLTGGGSRIRGLDTELQRRLTEEGYEQPCVKVVGENYKEFVAMGALSAAKQARENQWQQVIH